MNIENKSNTWCVNPYLNLNVESDGRVTPCCKNPTYSYLTAKKNSTINKESIINFWNSEDRKKLIKNLDSGIRVKSCHQCWEDEDSGKESLRMISNRVWGHLVSDNNQLPKLAYIALGNTCNLKCRICWENRSSQFEIEELKRSTVSKIKVLLDNSSKIREESFHPENDYFWKDVLKIFPEVIRLQFSGGEPMYVKYNQQFITKIIDLGYSKNMEITYNTNGTLYPEKTIHYLKEFDHVVLNFSIDAVNEKFTYIRHPGNFITWEKNLQRIKKFDPSWQINTVISVSMFSIWDLAETYEYCTNNSSLVILNNVHDGRSIKFMPNKLKLVIIKRLLEHKSKNPQWEIDRDSVIKLLQNSKFNYVKWKLFWREVKQRDEYRNESFGKTFPDYYQEIKKYL
jgi:MoaA/NifB/PqqE/SkfB family radical SAM enzyme